MTTSGMGWSTTLGEVDMHLGPAAGTSWGTSVPRTIQ